MKKYEALFILNTDGKEDGVREIIERISAKIAEAGGSVETTQKMDRKQFVRVADKKFTGGFYVNFIFSGDSSIVTSLQNAFRHDKEVFRILFTHATTVNPAAAVA